MLTVQKVSKHTKAANFVIGLRVISSTCPKRLGNESKIVSFSHVFFPGSAKVTLLAPRIQTPGDLKGAT